MTARLQAVGTAMPDAYVFKQSEIVEEFFAQQPGWDPAWAEVFAASGWSAGPRWPTWYARPSTADRMREFVPAARGSGRGGQAGPGTGRAGRAAEVGDLLAVSCTGYRPGLDVHLVDDLGLGDRSSAWPSATWAATRPCRRCARRPPWPPPRAAAPWSPAWSCAPSTCSPPGPARTRLPGPVRRRGGGRAGRARRRRPGHRSATVTVPGSEERMGWLVEDDGFHMWLSPRVPALVERGVGRLVEDLLAPHGLTADDVAHWAVHPGGPEIVDRVQRRLGLGDAQVARSREVGRRRRPLLGHGPVHPRAAAGGGEVEPGQWIVALAFGTGLTLEALLLRAWPRSPVRIVRYSHQGDVGFGILEDETVAAISPTPSAPSSTPASASAPRRGPAARPGAAEQGGGDRAELRRARPRAGQRGPAGAGAVPRSRRPRSSAPATRSSARRRGPGRLRGRAGREIVGKLVRRLEPAEAIQAVLGFTCANDVTARDLQRADGQWTRGKGFDTFCPLGPWIETDLDSSDLALHTLVNGEVRQQAHLPAGARRRRAAGLRVPVMTLLPGDVLLTGTPAGRPAGAGDRVEVESRASASWPTRSWPSRPDPGRPARARPLAGGARAVVARNGGRDPGRLRLVRAPAPGQAPASWARRAPAQGSGSTASRSCRERSPSRPARPVHHPGTTPPSPTLRRRRGRRSARSTRPWASRRRCRSGAARLADGEFVLPWLVPLVVDNARPLAGVAAVLVALVALNQLHRPWYVELRRQGLADAPRVWRVQGRRRTVA